LKIDKGHLHTFTAGKIRDYLNRYSFAMQYEYINDYYQDRDIDKKSTSLRAKVKGYTGISEFIYCAVCSKVI
jgi:hypothetical protein